MIVGVILAAGRSARLGRPKQLLPLDGPPLLTHVLRHAAASTLDEVVLVLGHEAAAIAAAVGDWGQRIVVNPDFASGQSSSVRAGLAALDPATEAVLFLLGDQPGVGPEIIDALVAAYRDSGAKIVVPVYGEIAGNPVLFDRSHFPELAELTGDQGARDIIRAGPPGLLRLPMTVPPPADVDTEDDYAVIVAAWPN